MAVHRIAAALLCATLTLLASSACQRAGDNPGSGTQSPGADSPSAGHTATSGARTSTSGAGPASTTQTETSQTTRPTANRPPIGNLEASPANGLCDFVPGGMVDGRDALQVSFFILLIGANPNELPGLVAVSAASGATSINYRSAVSNQARSVAALPVGGNHFGTRLTIRITVDTPDEVPETNESDNTITATVSLPSPRPSQAVELPCTLRRV